MKNYKLLLSFLFCLSTAAVFSQKSDQAKPVLFANFPDEIQLTKNLLQNTLNASEGEQVIISFNDHFRFKGIVLSNLQKYENLQSVIIKSSEFENAVLQVSRIKHGDESISYAGRIINTGAADGYEIKKDKNDIYHLTKFATKNILEDCSY